MIKKYRSKLVASSEMAVIITGLPLDLHHNRRYPNAVPWIRGTKRWSAPPTVDATHWSSDASPLCNRYCTPDRRVQAKPRRRRPRRSGSLARAPKSQARLHLRSDGLRRRPEGRRTFFRLGGEPATAAAIRVWER